MNIADQLVGLLASSIFANSDALRILKGELTSNQLSRIRLLITFQIRTAGQLLYPELRQPEVSQEALQAAEKLGVDLREHTWRSQPTFDRGRKKFHWEHVDTISEVQKACGIAASAEEVCSLLRARLRIAWILKEEDRKLTRLGYRSRRPDPDEAYRKAGIVLV